MSNDARAPRVLFFGMQGKFSYPSLLALQQAGIEIRAVVIPAEQSFEGNVHAIRRREQSLTSRPMLPILQSAVHTSIIQLAWERHIPVWEVYRMSDSETIDALEAYQPDVLCVVCFSKRIPRAILDIPRLGCLNVHPSLLPDNRGPEPLFWTFYEGNQRTGATIHLMDEAMDTGAIVAQEIVDVPNSISYAELESLCAELGGRLLAQSVWDLYHGVAKPIVQDETMGSYHAFPSEEDFVVPVAEWDARHVYNFICGVVSWGIPLHLQVGSQKIRIKKAISYSRKAIKITDNRQSKEEFWVRCRQGSVLVM